MRPDRPPVLRWRPGVRTRATAAGVAVVAAALAVGAVAFTTTVRARVADSIEASAAARADSLAAFIEAGPPTLDLPAGDPELLAQVVNGAGNVIAADPAVAGLEPFGGLGVAEVGSRFRVDDLFEAVEDARPYLEDESPYAVVVRPVALETDPGAVLVAATLEDANETVRASLPILLGGSALLLVVVGAVIWLLTGLALRPVEQMRAEAHRISGSALDVRLPLPGTRDEIHRLAVTLNEMLDRLESSAIRQRRFVSDASHELRSPLAALRAVVEVGDHPGTGSSAADAVGEIGRMERLVDDLLYLAGHDEGVPPDRRDEVDLDQIAGAEAAALTDRVSCRIDTSGIRPARVIGDPGRIAQLARNLLDNAARHAASTVWVATRTEDARAALEISDDGPGIPIPDRERVFERFVRLDTSRTRTTGGSGLGLAVARSIARRHGGEVRVAESRRGGATLIADFPAAD